jgi:hypothetical protein
MVSIGNRLLIILDDIFRQRPVSDNLFFISIMAILLWTLCCYAGYVLTRHGYSWQRSSPLDSPWSSSRYMTPSLRSVPGFLAGYIFLFAAVGRRMHFLASKNAGDKTAPIFHPLLGWTSIRLGLMTTAILVIFAWTAPALAKASTCRAGLGVP